MGEKTLIKRCINNLIDNGIKYGDKVNIELSKSSNNLFIKIEDDGPGIPEKEYENVYSSLFTKLTKEEQSQNQVLVLGCQ